MPTVSICIPSYNHAPYLPAAIESALGQTYRDLEVVIVDDGSTDGSLEIARAYERRDPERVRVFTHPGNANLGVSATSNLARRQARGVFWTGLPSDDVLHRDRIDRLLHRFAQRPDLDVLYSYARHIDEFGRPRRDLGLFGVDITHEPHPADFLIPGNLIPAMTILARRQSFERVGDEEESLVYSDWELWIRLFAAARVGFVPKVLVDFRVHGSNTSVGSDRSIHLARHLEVVETLERKARSTAPLARPRFRALLALEHAYLCFCLGDLDDARRHVDAAFEQERALRESPAPLAPFLIRWEDEALQLRLQAAEYAALAAATRDRNPPDDPVLAVPRTFALLVLSARAATGEAPTEWRRLVAAVHYLCAAKRHWRSGERALAGARGASAVRTYPQLVAGRSTASLLRRSMQPRVLRMLPSSG